MAKLCVKINGQLVEIGDGDSAYQVALKNGFVGTEQQWLNSLKGTQITINQSDKHWLIDGIDSGVSSEGSKLSIDQTSHNWLINGIDTGVLAEGESPYVGYNGNWFIGATDTTVKAAGITPNIDSATKNWFIDGVDTGVCAEGLTPFIGINNNWWIGLTDTGVSAMGVIPTINTSGNWEINGVDSGVKAKVDNPTIDPVTKNWMVGTFDTGVMAEGITPTINPLTENWMIGTTDTGKQAIAHDGKDGLSATIAKVKKTWLIGYATDINYSSTITPSIVNGTWIIGTTDTGIEDDGVMTYHESFDGKFFIGVDTNVNADGNTTAGLPVVSKYSNLPSNANDKDYYLCLEDEVDHPAGIYIYDATLSEWRVAVGSSVSFDDIYEQAYSSSISTDGDALKIIDDSLVPNAKEIRLSDVTPVVVGFTPAINGYTKLISAKDSQVSKYVLHSEVKNYSDSEIDAFISSFGNIPNGISRNEVLTLIQSVNQSTFDGNAVNVNYVTTVGLTSTNIQTALDEAYTKLVQKIEDVKDASVIDFTSSSGLVSNNTQDALDELNTSVTTINTALSNLDIKINNFIGRLREDNGIYTLNKTAEEITILACYFEDSLGTVLTVNSNKDYIAVNENAKGDSIKGHYVYINKALM